MNSPTTEEIIRGLRGDYWDFSKWGPVSFYVESRLRDQLKEITKLNEKIEELSDYLADLESQHCC